MRSKIGQVAIVGGVVATIVAVTASAGLYVYEPYDYAPDQALAGLNGGTGFSGAWVDVGGLNGWGAEGEAYVYDAPGNDDPATNWFPNPQWDGVIDNLLQTGNWVGESPIILKARPFCYRALAQDADTMAGVDNVLWVSVAYHYGTSDSAARPAAIALTTGGAFQERGANQISSGNGLGVANGVGWGVDTWVRTMAFSNKLAVASTITQIRSIPPPADLVLVLKYEFGASDTVSAWAFLESEERTEAIFDTNAGTTTNELDESTLDTLTVGMNRAANAWDEIRIGDTFVDVAAVPPLKGTIVIVR